ncbi:MAG: exonuclease domain-containing protein [Propionibacteriaceae bacterium]
MTPLFTFGHERRRRKAVEAAPPGPLRDYLTAPQQDPRTPLADVRLLALDFETTSLDAASGVPLSAGWVPVDGTSVRLGGAGSVGFLPPAVGVGDSAVFHGITDDAASTGLEESRAVEQILAALTGRVLLAHHASVEASFLSAACRRIWGLAVEFPSVDTLDIEHRLVTRGGSEPTPGSLRLGAARERYGLPSYDAHEALTDALACAELYLAQLSVLGARGALKSVMT